MAKEKVTDAVIRQIEAKKKAVMEAAEAFKAIKIESDPEWAESRKGKNFQKSMDLSTEEALAEKKTKTQKVSDFLSGYESKSIYGRLIASNYGTPKRMLSGLPEAMGGFTQQDRKVRAAQQKLKTAQQSLHQTMDARFGTNVGGMANENRSLMEAAEGFTEKRGMLFGEPKSVVGTKDSLLTDLGKPFSSGASDIGSIFLGSGRSLTTKPGPFGIPLPSIERGDLPKKAFLTPKFLHKRKGVTGIIGNVAEIFTGMAKANSLGELIGFAIGGSIVAAVKITGNVLGMVFDAVKLVARLPELAVRATRFVGNAAYAGVKGGALVAYEGLRALAKGVFTLAKPTADFSLKDHGASKDDVASAVAEHAEVEAAINDDPAAFEAALEAIKTADANEEQPEQIEKAGREAGQKSLETSDRAIQNDPAAKKAADKAEKKTLKSTGSPEQATLAGRKAGQTVLSEKADKAEAKAEAKITADEEAIQTAMGSTIIQQESTNPLHNKTTEPEIEPEATPEATPEASPPAQKQPEIQTIEQAIKYSDKAKAAYDDALGNEPNNPWAQKAANEAATDSILTQLQESRHEAAHDVAATAFNEAGGVVDGNVKNQETQLEAREQAAIAGVNALVNPKPAVVMSNIPLPDSRPRSLRSPAEKFKDDKKKDSSLDRVTQHNEAVTDHEQKTAEVDTLEEKDEFDQPKNW